MSYARYEHCVESGLPWLREIPAHWNVIQSRRLFSQRKERARSGDEQLTASQKHGIIFQKEFMALENQRVVQVFIGSEILKHVEPNDFVISMRSFQGGLEWCRYSGCVSSAYVGLTPIKHVVPEFFYYLFKCDPYIQALQSTSNLVRDGQALRFENFAQVSLPLIPIPEQTKIANFLDHETAKIDQLIEKQQALIALLKEKRQAVISHAVTKGLNPSAPLKDSGIEWLGQVPKHWTPIQFKFLIKKIDQGRSPECEARLALPDEWGVLKSGCVNRGVFCEDEHKALPANIQPTLSAEVKEGDLLMSRASGSPDLIGSVGLVGNVRPRLMMSDKIFRLQPESTVLSKFIWRMTASTPVRKQIELSINGAEGLANNITKESIGRLFVTCPPIEEQNAIVDHLETRCAQIDKLVSNAELQVTLLQERRTALISAAVTGKIDVRAWQPPAS